MSDKPASTAARFSPRLITPSEEQRAIQVAHERTIIVEANAGAAKTTTLALRVAESLTRGVPVHRLIALTHTGPACVALQSTLAQIGVARNVVAQLRIQTFEDFSKAILQGIDDHRVEYVDENEQLRTHFWDAVQRVEDDEDERWRDELNMPAIGDSWFVEEFLKINARLKGSMRDVLERDGQHVSPSTPAASASTTRSSRSIWLMSASAARKTRTRPDFAARWTPPTIWRATCTTARPWRACATGHSTRRSCWSMRCTT
ncbi:UvrD-helicase domain-containing protein [Diaphorobacter aerolatus]|uniref:UvrD-helicase domain-containing protein n=1 Tax=Diaphorobacter aerolatus TaxID=1288495 RepID=A0A7H0GGB6_9BURK|nr:UvrD-helicase domain-containing protein [Diaphorobacter aerolatus]QNP47332.1 UvrD-helicase domain-containing protein [Diaphorobacter aerolatus]